MTVYDGKLHCTCMKMLNSLLNNATFDWQIYNFILANSKTYKIATNGRKIFKNRDIPEFPIHYYRQIFAKIGTNGQITLFFTLFLGSK